MIKFLSELLNSRINQKSDKSKNEQEVSALLDDLRKIGPDKPLGYLPIETIIEVCKTDPNELKAELEQRGLKTLTLSEKESSVFSGALYAYNEAVLRSILNANIQILEQAGWPSDPELFIRHLSTSANQKTPLFNLIADTFEDKINPGRLDS